MGIISRPRSNPAMIRAVARYCDYRGLMTVAEERLRETIAPILLTSSSGTDSAAGAGTAWKDTVDLAIELGIAKRRDDALDFDSRLIADLAVDDVSGFRRALRRIVFAQEQNDALWEYVQDGTWSSEGSREFSRIAVWLLDTSPGELAHDGAYEAARRSIEGAAKLVENDEQWRVFVRWAEALGVASRVAGLQLGDPTVAVEEELGDVFGSEDVLPALTVRDRLATALPVLRGGKYAKGIERFLVAKPRRLEGDSGRSLAFALTRLVQRGLISFDRRSDADQLVLDDPHSDANPTHIRLEGLLR
jgi:hypothetical protein